MIADETWKLQAYQDATCIAALEQTLSAYLENEDRSVMEEKGFALEQAIRQVKQRKFISLPASPVEPAGDERDGWPTWLANLRMYRDSFSKTHQVLQQAHRVNQLMRRNCKDAERGLIESVDELLLAAPALLAENTRLRAALTSFVGGATGEGWVQVAKWPAKHFEDVEILYVLHKGWAGCTAYWDDLNKLWRRTAGGNPIAKEVCYVAPVPRLPALPALPKAPATDEPR